MPTQTPLISVNGQLGAGISPLDRGFAYGDGLFESCRLLEGRMPLWRFHLERLRAGCERLQIPLDEARLNASVSALLAEGRARDITTGTLKIIVTRGEGGRGYRLPDLVSPTLCVGLYPAAPGLSGETGVKVRVCRQRICRSPALAGIKHLNRLEHILARAEWRDDAYAEGLLLDESGCVVEASVSNVFIVRAGQLVTPDIRWCGVDGVMRRAIVERLAPALGTPVTVKELSLADITAADELLVCNSSYGIWPVISLSDPDSAAPLGEWQPGPVTLSLQEQLQHLWQYGLSNTDNEWEVNAQ